MQKLEQKIDPLGSKGHTTLLYRPWPEVCDNLEVAKSVGDELVKELSCMFPLGEQYVRVFAHRDLSLVAYPISEYYHVYTQVPAMMQDADLVIPDVLPSNYNFDLDIVIAEDHIVDTAGKRIISGASFGRPKITSRFTGSMKFSMDRPETNQ